MKRSDYSGGVVGNKLKRLPALPFTLSSPSPTMQNTGLGRRASLCDSAISARNRDALSDEPVVASRRAF